MKRNVGAKKGGKEKIINIAFTIHSPLSTTNVSRIPAEKHTEAVASEVSRPRQARRQNKPARSCRDAYLACSEASMRCRVSNILRYS